MFEVMGTLLNDMLASVRETHRLEIDAFVCAATIRTARKSLR
jgi:hypothetical protein